MFVQKQFSDQLKKKEYDYSLYVFKLHKRL